MTLSDAAERSLSGSRALEAAPPALERVAGKSEHEVERESPESVRPREREGGGGPFGTVDPTQALELVGMEALNPHREAVDPGGGPGIEQRRAHRLRIGLERDLSSRRQVEVLGQDRPQAREMTWGQRRGGAAAEERRAEGEAPRFGRSQRRLALECGEVAFDRRRRQPAAREIAVAAAHGAEGNVDVEPGARLAPG